MASEKVLMERTVERGLRDTNTLLGLKALAQVVLKEREPSDVLTNLIFIRNVRLNEGFDLIDERSIEQHYRREGVLE